MPSSHQLTAHLWQYYDLCLTSDGSTDQQSASFALSGRIHDPKLGFEGDETDEPQSPFHSTSIIVRMCSSPNPKILESLENNSGSGMLQGIMEVSKGMEHPIVAHLFLKPDMLNACYIQAMRACDHHKYIRVKFDFIIDKEKPEWMLDFEDFDVSVEKKHTIVRWEILNTGEEDIWRGRVRRLGYEKYASARARWNFLLAYASYKIDAERAAIRDISCEGRLIGGGAGESFPVGLRASIEFSERDVQKLSEEDFFGRFAYWPASENKSSLENYCHVELAYLPQDRDTIIDLLLNQQADTKVWLELEFASSEAELLSAEQLTKGNLLHYKFHVSRAMINYGPVLEQLKHAEDQFYRRMTKTKQKYVASKDRRDQRFLGILSAKRNPGPGHPDYLDWANRVGKYDDCELQTSAGVSEGDFNRIHHRLVFSHLIDAADIERLSLEQIKALERKISE